MLPTEAPLNFPGGIGLHLPGLSFVDNGCMHDARMEKGAPQTVQPAAMSTQNLPESPSAAPARLRPFALQRSATEVMGDRLRKRLGDDETPTLTQIQTHRMRRSVDVPRSGPVTPIISPIHSRRTSLLIPKDGDDKLDFTRVGREDKDKEKGKEKLQEDKKKDKASSSTE